MDRILVTTELRFEQDLVQVRQRARQIAALLGFETQDQTRIATAVSEIARNAFEYGGGGKVEFAVATLPRTGRMSPESGYHATSSVQSALVIRVQDKGKGIADLQAILDGQYRSVTGMGLGIIGAKRLMDDFDIETARGQGTRVRMSKNLPPTAPPVTPQVLGRVGTELTRTSAASPLSEVMRQNQELLQSMEALRARQVEIERLNRELEDTNRGVVALYTELDEKAGYLQRAAELKTSFLSNMSHEFRTPLNAVLSLSQILLDRTDGDLSGEQEKQVNFIRKAALDLSELVNDLLDLARVEAGKVVIRPTEFTIADLFGALRGMLRPLLAHNSSVSLVFEEEDGLEPLLSDEGKVSQILRNLVSNALKFTERGEVRVTASRGTDGKIVFAVIDTGIGIAVEDQERIFEEFVQIEGPIQRRVKGTGLGLPLSRKLAELLGGRLWLQSRPGSGSTFWVTIPQLYVGPHEVSYAPEVTREIDPNRKPVLVVEDNAETIFVYDKYLKNTEFQPIPARTLREARDALAQFRPAALILDILLEDESTWSFLGELKESEATRDLPVIVATVIDNQNKASALGADAFGIKPLQREWLLTQLRRLGGKSIGEKVLVVDDDEISRYLLKGLLASMPYQVIEAEDGEEGLKLALAERPRAIILDLVMPKMDGFETLERLRSDPTTKDIPVIVNTSSRLDEERSAELKAKACAILSKESRSREAALSALQEALTAAGLPLSLATKESGRG
jgi:signal transduction histidine kinase/CheY-like chemotaxis protein